MWECWAKSSSRSTASGVHVDLPGEEADGLGEAADRIDVQSLDDGGLGGVGRGHEQPIAALGDNLEGHREDSLDGPVSPVWASSPTMA